MVSALVLLGAGGWAEGGVVYQHDCGATYDAAMVRDLEVADDVRGTRLCLCHWKRGPEAAEVSDPTLEGLP